MLPHGKLILSLEISKTRILFVITNFEMAMFHQYNFKLYRRKTERMASFLTVCYYISIALGLMNLRYNWKTQQLDLYYWPIMIYSVLLNILFFGLQPITMIYSTKVSYYCEFFGPLVIMKLMIGTAHCMTYMSIVWLTWFKRKQLRRLFHRYLKLVDQYLNEANLQDHQDTMKNARGILRKKLTSSICKMIVLYVNIYHYVSNVDCVYVERFSHVVVSIYYGILNLHELFVDISVILGLLLIDVGLNMLLTDLNSIERDIRLMIQIRHRQASYAPESAQQDLHNKWRYQLSHNVESISEEVLKLQSLARDHIEIYQIPILFLLSAIFMGLVNLMFNIVVYAANFENLDTMKFLFYLLILAANINNFMIFYNICESLKHNYRKMCHQVYRIAVYDSVGNGYLYRRDALVLNVSFNERIEVSKMSKYVCRKSHILYRECEKRIF